MGSDPKPGRRYAQLLELATHHTCAAASRVHSARIRVSFDKSDNYANALLPIGQDQRCNGLQRYPGAWGQVFSSTVKLDTERNRFRIIRVPNWRRAFPPCWCAETELAGLSDAALLLVPSPCCEAHRSLSRHAYGTCIPAHTLLASVEERFWIPIWRLILWATETWTRTGILRSCVPTNGGMGTRTTTRDERNRASADCNDSFDGTSGAKAPRSPHHDLTASHVIATNHQVNPNRINLLPAFTTSHDTSLMQGGMTLERGPQTSASPNAVTPSLDGGFAALDSARARGPRAGVLTQAQPFPVPPWATKSEVFGVLRLARPLLERAREHFDARASRRRLACAELCAAAAGTRGAGPTGAHAVRFARPFPLAHHDRTFVSALDRPARRVGRG